MKSTIPSPLRDFKKTIFLVRLSHFISLWSFLLFVCHKLVLLVFSWWRDLNSCSRAMAQFVSPRVLKVSISSTFYVHIFHTNVVSAAFSSYFLALSKNLYKKMRAYDVDEIDYRVLPSYSYKRKFIYQRQNYSLFISLTVWYDILDCVNCNCNIVNWPLM